MLYALRQAWRNVRESWTVALQTWLMMGISLFVLGAFACLSVQVEAVLAHWEGEAPVLVYLKTDISTAQQKALQARLSARKEIRSVRAISPEEAMRRMRKSLGKKKDLLKGLDVPLFPASLELDLHPWARREHLIEKMSQAITRWRGVQEVDYGREWFAPLWQMAYWVRAILAGGGLLLLLCTSLMAAGTIRLSLLLHQDEIEIMRLVGATERFVRGPFYTEGAASGFLAACSALLALVLLFGSVDRSYGESFRVFTSLPMRFLSVQQVGWFLFGGLMAGIVGSWLALLRPPKRQKDRALW
ncbi:permease-like cell division protein FtsX [Myxococcota bacterium]|nr:permease-like cell division protein FtsX [Myxococcota bacterium]